MSNLFGWDTPKPSTMSHLDDPYTSTQAALKALKTAKGITRDIINELDRIYPEGISSEELAKRLGIQSSVSGNDAAKRLSNLKSKGVVEACREKVLNAKGNPVDAYKLRFRPSDKQSRWTP